MQSQYKVITISLTVFLKLCLLLLRFIHFINETLYFPLLFCVKYFGKQHSSYMVAMQIYNFLYIILIHMNLISNSMIPCLNCIQKYKIGGPGWLLIKGTTLAFSSGLNLMIRGLELCVGFCGEGVQSAWDSVSLCLSLPFPHWLAISLSK